MSTVKFYSEGEEKLNIRSHAFGIMLSVLGLIMLLTKAQSALSFGASLAYGISMILLYTASTLYHSAKDPVKRSRLRILDHASIYILIAGTYTPFTLITLKGDIGWIVFIVIWSFATVGIALKLFFTGRFDKLSTVIYILMGWIIVFAINPLVQQLDRNGLILLLSGGGAYTIGGILYAIKTIKYNHAIFHFFVLIGSLLHFLAVYFYVIS